MPVSYGTITGRNTCISHIHVGQKMHGAIFRYRREREGKTFRFVPNK
jgi:hypothetical protein